MTPALLPPDAHRCIDAAAKQKGLTVADILGSSRRAQIAEARHVAAALLVRWAGYSQTEAGALLNRDRTTVISSLDTVADPQRGGDLGVAFAALISYLGPPPDATKPGVCRRCLKPLRNCRCLADRGIVS